jgi:AcrR family transcriptional regulator
MARTTTARGQARREQLIAVALRAFAAQGFRGASTASIAEEARISEPGLLHHFPSKKDLLFGVLEHYEEETVARVRERVEAGGSFCDQLLVLARRHEADPTYIRLYVVLSAESVDSMHPAHDWFRERYDRTRARFAERLASDQERGVIASEHDPAVLARTLIALLDGLEQQFLLSDGELDIVTPLAAYLDGL